MNDAQTTAEMVIRLLTERGETLAVAESCTGGLVGHLLTEVPGSSEVFLGGVIAYANELKEKIGVPAEILREHGAVSAEAAGQMASGVRRWAAADYGLSVTGIAGPGGATEAKPVGLTYVGLGTRDRTEVEKHQFAGQRSEVKGAAATVALSLLRREIERNDN